jgi:hypothetical protein
MWRSVFLHEFVDHRIDNFQALPGRPTQPSFLLAPERDPATRINSVLIRGGSHFDYRFTQPLQDIIGVSCRVRILYPAAQPDFQFPILDLGTASLVIKTESNPTDVNATITSPAIFINHSFSPFRRVDLPANRYVDFRFDWHTSGQARILQDGQLVAYRHSTSPRTVIAIDRVVFGLPNHQVTPHTPSYRIARVFVRVLSRVDALAIFSRLLPNVAEPVDPKNRCREIAIAGTLGMVDRLREFMTSIHQALSRSWSTQAGPVQGAFQTEATKAHALAVKAVSELVMMLRTGDFLAPDRFLKPFTEFLRILRATKPAEFAALAAELGEKAIVPDDCKESLAAAGRDSREAFQPLIDLLNAATEQIERIASGGE